MKHHALIIAEKNTTGGIYLLDFTPVVNGNDEMFITQFNLLLGKTIEAETRLRFIKNATFLDDYQIRKSPDLLDIKNVKQSKQITRKIYNGIQNSKIKRFLGKYLTKPVQHMNLYRNNCQHFCKNVIETEKSQLLYEYRPFLFFLYI